MRSALNLEIEVYIAPTNSEGIGTYFLKVHFTELGHYLKYKFALFHAHNGEYELYPGTTTDRYGKYVRNFEFSKQTAFYDELLDEVVDVIEAESGIIITRRQDKAELTMSS